MPIGQLHVGGSESRGRGAERSKEALVGERVVQWRARNNAISFKFYFSFLLTDRTVPVDREQGKGDSQGLAPASYCFESTPSAPSRKPRPQELSPPQLKARADSRSSSRNP